MSALTLSSISQLANCKQIQTVDNQLLANKLLYKLKYSQVAKQPQVLKLPGGSSWINRCKQADAAPTRPAPAPVPKVNKTKGGIINIIYLITIYYYYNKLLRLKSIRLKVRLSTVFI